MIRNQTKKYPFSDNTNLKVQAAAQTIRAIYNLNQIGSHNQSTTYPIHLTKSPTQPKFNNKTALL